MLKSKATLIFAALSSFHNEVEDALEADLDLIEAGTFTLVNLRALETSQDLLKK